MNYKSIFNIIKNYHWQSLFFKYWKMLLVAFAIPMIVFFCVFLYMFNVAQTNDFNQSFVASAYKSQESLSIITNDFENYYNYINENPWILKLMDSESPNSGGIDNYEMITSILSDFNNFKSIHPYIDSIFVYSAKSNYVLSTRTCNGLNKHPYRSFVTQCIASGDFYTNISTIDNERNITLSYAIKPHYYNVVDGLFIININCNKLAQHISTNYLSEKILFFNYTHGLLNAESISSTDDILSFKNHFADNSAKIQNSDYLVERTIDDVICYIPIDDLDIIFALVAPSISTKNMIDSSTKMILSFILISLFATILLSFFTSLNMYKSIANIISEIGSAPIPGDENINEANFISAHFLSMLQNKSEIEDELLQKIKLLKQSQALALQTQINPHFIFNTLNLVNLMIIRITQQNCAPAQIIARLSDIMHYSLKTDKFITTVENELRYAKKYIEIEQIKHNNSFEFETNICEETEQSNIIKFTLQPILENCIEHGIKKTKDRKCTIKLKTYIQNNTLYITISDNGAGITPERLEEVNKNLNSIDAVTTGKHIGLANVNQRIKLIWGENAEIRLIPLEQGLSVEISHPLTNNEIPSKNNN